MRVRGVDSNHDWMFGKGRNDYKANKLAVMQNLLTRLKSFLGDCFYELDAGIDWINLLGSKRIAELKLAISTTILNTEGVTAIISIDVSFSKKRSVKLVYNVMTAYGATGIQTIEQGVV